MWYLDSACSRHMCGDRLLFTTLEDHKAGSMTFENSGKASILGKGTIEILGMPYFKNVLFIDGLKKNMLSISQICDFEFEVHFGKNCCYVFDYDGDCLLKGTRISNNYYCISLNSNLRCSNAKVDESEL